MFVSGVEVISSRLNNIAIDSLNNQSNMHPNADKPPTCQKNNLPLLHLTPTTANQRRSDSPQQGADNPWLLKPQHEIPPTPPPKNDQKQVNFFPQRIG